jgi:hypothetical protein
MERLLFLVSFLIFKFENLATFISLLSYFGLKVFHERCFVIVFDKCTCGLKNIQISFAHSP